MKQRYRLGLDIGTNSIGWCVFDLDADDQLVAIRRMGVRIFSDGRAPDKSSLAVNRRMARQQRRQRERTVQRRTRFLAQLVEYGLLPAAEVERKALVRFDPYELRDRALREPLPLPQFGRALYHLARKRGFKSSRKSIGTQDVKEAGKISKGISRLHELLRETSCETVGQLLWQRHQRREPVLARPGRSGDANGGYAYYPDRALVLEEFDLLWQRQQQWAPERLTDAAYRALRDTLAYQRPLKEVQPGYCLYEENEKRVRRSHPLAARYRIAQDIANLRIERSALDVQPLSLEQQRTLHTALLSQAALNWPRIKSLLGLPRDVALNLERAKKKGLQGDPTTVSLSAPDCFGSAWYSMLDSAHAHVINALCLANTTEDLDRRLRENGIVVSDDQLEAISRVNVSEDFSDLSLSALRKLVPVMEATFCTPDVAANTVGYANQYDMLPDESALLPEVPYYGQVLRRFTQQTPFSQVTHERLYGRIANPTVHVGLNQLRKLLNALIRRYGRPHQIVVELAREFGMSGQHRDKLMREQQKNEQANELRRQYLRASGRPVNRENLMRLRLWEEMPVLDRVCVYSGATISQDQLFSSAIEIDHILPFSKSLDDGIGNLALGYREANRFKGSRDPHAAFGHSPSPYDWESITARVSRFAEVNPQAWNRKARRFCAGALEEFLKDRDFLARHLTDTAYLSRLAKQYLAHVCLKDRVWTATGKLTSLLRAKWQLNDALGGSVKNRNDHRHHAIDAAVVGACDRRIIQSIATAASRHETGVSERMLDRVDWPFESFTETVRQTVAKVVVSHRPDHSLAGGLHNATRYGWREGPDAKGISKVVHRVPLDTLKVGDLDSLCDQTLASKLKRLASPGQSAADFRAALLECGQRTGTQSVRLLERLNVREIRNPHRERGTLVKTDGNYCYEITRDQKGRWCGCALSLFNANQLRLSRHTGADGNLLVMRLRKNDTVIIQDGDRTRIMRVAQLSQGKIRLAEHMEANADARNRDNSRRRRAGDGGGLDTFEFKQVSESTLRKLKGRLAFVDPLGYVNDPGFHE